MRGPPGAAVAGFACLVFEEASLLAAVDFFLSRFESEVLLIHDF